MIESIPNSPQQILGAIVAGLVATVVVTRATEGNITIKEGGPRRNTKWIPEWLTPFVKLIEEGLNWLVGVIAGSLYYLIAPQFGVNLGNIVGVAIIFGWIAGRGDADKDLNPNTARSRGLLVIGAILTFHQLILSFTGHWLLWVIGLFLAIWVAHEHLIEKGSEIVSDISY